MRNIKSTICVLTIVLGSVFAGSVAETRGNELLDVADVHGGLVVHAGCRDGKLTTSLRPDVDPELCERLGSLYTYIYRRLVDATTECQMTRHLDSSSQQKRSVDEQPAFADVHRRSVGQLVITDLESDRN